MFIQYRSADTAPLKIPQTARIILLILAILAAVGPNGVYLYSIVTDPGLNQAALENPVALAFMIEAMMLLTLFLWYVYYRTKSWLQVLLYLLFAFLGSLAFSFPLFMFNQSQPKPDVE